MELPEPFHSAKFISCPSLMRCPKVSPYAKVAARGWLQNTRRAKRAWRLRDLRDKQFVDPAALNSRGSTALHRQGRTRQLNAALWAGSPLTSPVTRGHAAKLVGPPN